jgi:hypothetical protein
LVVTNWIRVLRVKSSNPVDICLQFAAIPPPRGQDAEISSMAKTT